MRNPIRTISTSILSSVTAAQAETNISDLRKTKSEKIQDLYKTDENADFTAEDEAFLNEKSPEDTNEAVPSILQKKLEKIMRKLHFIAQLVQRFNPTGSSDDKTNTTNNDSDFDIDDDVEDETSNSTPNPDEKTKEEFYDPRQQESEDFKHNSAASTNAGLGVHLMEILGSLFGLIYGAAIQLTSATTSKPTL